MELHSVPEAKPELIPAQALSRREASAAAAVKGGAADATRRGAANTDASFRKLRRVTTSSRMATTIHHRPAIAMLNDSDAAARS